MVGKRIAVSYDLMKLTKQLGRLPVVHFAEKIQKNTYYIQIKYPKKKKKKRGRNLEPTFLPKM